MVFGILTFFPSILLLGFPRELPGAREMREEQIKNGNIRRATKTGKPTLKMILPELKDLLTNWTFLFSTLGLSAIILYSSVLLPFYPKILLSKFGVTAEKVGYVLGAVLTPSLGGKCRCYYTRQKIMSCNRLLKTGCNNIVGATLFLVVNNIEQYC